MTPHRKRKVIDSSDSSDEGTNNEQPVNRGRIAKRAAVGFNSPSGLRKYDGGRGVYVDDVSSPLNAHSPAALSQHSELDPGKYWEARSILDENCTKYLIDWEGVDPQGKRWEPTWESKDSATVALVQEWENRIRPNRSRRKSDNQKQRSHLRTKRQVLSSSDCSEDERPNRRETTEPTENSSPAQSPPAIGHTDFFIQISQHSSLDREAYQRFSQDTSSQDPSQQAVPLTRRLSALPNKSPGSSQDQAPELMVPDSQSPSGTPLLHTATPSLHTMANPTRPNGAAHLSAPTTPTQAIMPNVDRLMHDDGAWGGRSPSVIPAPLEARPPVGDSRLIADDTGIPDGQIDVPAPQLSADIVEETPVEIEADAAPTTLDRLEIPILPQNEHIISLALPGRLKDDYYKILANHADVIRRVFRAHEVTQGIRQDAVDLIQRLNNLCTHPDLNDTSTHTFADIEKNSDLMGWTEQMSPKFAFVKYFLTFLAREDRTVAIVCKAGNVATLVQKILSIANFTTTFVTPTGGVVQTYQNTDGSKLVNVAVVPLHELQDHFRVPLPIHVVIALDDAFRSLKPVIRSTLPPSTGSSEKAAPVLHPLVVASPEHVLLAQPTNIKSEHSLKAVMHCIVQTRKQCGELDAECYNTIAFAEEAAEWVRRGATSTWWVKLVTKPLVLKGLQLVPASQETIGSSHSTHNSNMHNPTPLVHPQHPGSRPGTPSSMRKRVLENTLQSPDNIHKRARMDLHNGHPDSSILARNSMPSAATQTQFTSQHVVLSSTDNVQHPVSSTESIEQLKADLKGQSDGLSLALDKFEKAKELLRVTRNDKDSLIQQVERLEKQAQIERDSKEKVRAEREELQGLLDQATKDLTNLAVTGENSSDDQVQKFRSELAQEKLRCATLTSDIALIRNGKLAELEKLVVNFRNELEFFRTQYQDRDSSLSIAHQELEEQKEDNRKLRAQLENVRASQGSAKLRQANVDEQMKLLKVENEGLKRQLGQKRGEKERGRGMATRSGSTAPRSPRGAAAASPAGSRILSRHGSPVRREGVAGRRGRQLQGL